MSFAPCHHPTHTVHLARSQLTTCDVNLQNTDGLKIVILGDAHSINVQRWQQGLSDAGAEVHLLSLHIRHSTDEKVQPIPAPRIPGLPEKLRYFTAIPA